MVRGYSVLVSPAASAASVLSSASAAGRLSSLMVSASALSVANAAGAAVIVIAAAITTAMITLDTYLFFISFPLFVFICVTEKTELQKRDTFYGSSFSY